MDIASYLDRIGLTDLPPPTVDGLAQLQDHHMRHVPFENLDVVMRRPLDLTLAGLFDKIVTRRRGGYCFELNTLYAELLRAAGFVPVMMMARVWYGRPEGTPPRTHLVLRVEIDSDIWVTDVGFGGRAARVPIRLHSADPIDDGDGHIRIQPDGEFGYRVARHVEGVWVDQYSAETMSAPWADVLMGNHWTEHHPSSKFRHSIGVGLFTDVGRTGFYNGQLTQRGTDKAVIRVDDLDAVLTLLRDTFGLDPNPTDQERARLSAVL